MAVDIVAPVGGPGKKKPHAQIDSRICFTVVLASYSTWSLSCPGPQRGFSKVW